MPNNFKLAIANFFGAMGYLFCGLQWIWTALLYFSVIKSTAIFFSTNPDAPTQQPIAQIAPNSATIIIGGIVTIIMIIITIYIFVKIPSTISRASKKVVESSASATAPLIIKSQHKKLTPKSRMVMTAKMITILKIVMIILPITLAAASQLIIDPAFTMQISMAVSIILGALAALHFVAQYLLNRLAKVATTSHF